MFYFRKLHDVKKKGPTKKLPFKTGPLEEISRPVMKLINRSLKTAENFLKKRRGFTYHPETFKAYVDIVLRQTHCVPDKVVFIRCGNSTKCLIFVKNGRAVSINCQVSDDNITTDLYNKLQMCSYKQVLLIFHSTLPVGTIYVARMPDNLTPSLNKAAMSLLAKWATPDHNLISNELEKISILESELNQGVKHQLTQKKSIRNLSTK